MVEHNKNVPICQLYIVQWYSGGPPAWRLHHMENLASKVITEMKVIEEHIVSLICFRPINTTLCLMLRGFWPEEFT